MYFVLYDDDCGFCSKVAKTIENIFRKNIRSIAMGHPILQEKGYNIMGDDFWYSFHFIKNSKWYTGVSGMIEISSLLPFGRIWKKLLQFPLISYLLLKMLTYFRFTRKQSCKIR
ncbi:MAG: DUF393 domain-containing protein [Candidatus Heimdallarchaeota archaeon]|nr:DUF393 domain-containing protein [Candidatus Heimdallarchaeota archaeon]MDH5646441.1 DUF393 domain-containing protein [Candidatus Heimdallarchaeota archaeon]